MDVAAVEATRLGPGPDVPSWLYKRISYQGKINLISICKYFSNLLFRLPPSFLHTFVETPSLDLCLLSLQAVWATSTPMMSDRLAL